MEWNKSSNCNLRCVFYFYLMVSKHQKKDFIITALRNSVYFWHFNKVMFVYRVKLYLFLFFISSKSTYMCYSGCIINELYAFSWFPYNETITNSQTFRILRSRHFRKLFIFIHFNEILLWKQTKCFAMWRGLKTFANAAPNISKNSLTVPSQL